MSLLSTFDQCISRGLWFGLNLWAWRVNLYTGKYRNS